MTTHEQPTTLRALPALSILHKPAHSPNFLLLSTFISGIWCSLHNAWTNFLYIGSSQLSARMQSMACLLKYKKKSISENHCIYNVIFVLCIRAGRWVEKHMISVSKEKTSVSHAAQFHSINIIDRISISHLSKALAASWSPCTTPSWMREFFRTSCSAVLTSMLPPTAITDGTSSLQRNNFTEYKNWEYHYNSRLINKSTFIALLSRFISCRRPCVYISLYTGNSWKVTIDSSIT